MSVQTRGTADVALNGKLPSGNFDVTTDVYSGGGGRQDYKHMTKERPAGNQLCPKAWEMKW